MKRKFSTRLISMLLVIATMVGLLAVPASAADTLNDSRSVPAQTTKRYPSPRTVWM